MDGNITEYNSEKKQNKTKQRPPPFSLFLLSSLCFLLWLPLIPSSLSPPYPHPTPPPPYEDATGAPREKVSESVIK